MAQNDFVIDNGTGQAVRLDIQNAFQALAGNNFGSSTPSTTYHYQWWADTSANVMKIRNSNNTDWIELFQLDGTLTLEDGSASAPALGFRDDLDTGIFSGGANIFNIATGGTERFRVDASGRVGINETALSSFNSIGDDLVISQASGSAGITIRSGSSSTGVLAFTDGANTNFRGDLRYDHNGDYMRFSTDGSERLRINSSGNVGIGVTSVSERLHVAAAGNCNITSECTASGSGANAALQAKSADGGDFLIQTGNAVSGGLRVYDGGASAERLRLDSSGNVGIGTTSPSDNLDIASTVPTIRFTDTDGGPSYHQIKAPGNGDLRISCDVGNSSSSDSEIQFDIHDSNKMVIQSSGNVGIGTTAPDVKLTVATSSGDAFIRCTGGTNQGLLLNKSDGTLIGAFASGGTIGGTVNDVGLRAESGNKILFSTGTTIRLTIDASGNIGAPSGTNIFNASDLRLKKNVADLDKGLSAIKSLRPVSFNWKDGFCNEEKQTLYGFIAQEVKTIDSNLVQKFSDSPLTIEKQVIDNPLTVNEKLIIPMLVKAIQELEVKVAALEAA